MKRSPFRKENSPFFINEISTFQTRLHYILNYIIVVTIIIKFVSVFINQFT